MEHPLIHSQPCEAFAEEGHVFLDSDIGVAATLTPEAAAETAQRLMSAADKASEQRRDRLPPR